MLQPREIDTKLCQVHTKIHINAILYKSIKQIIFNKYVTNLKTTISHIAFLIDIIDNTIRPKESPPPSS